VVRRASRKPSSPPKLHVSVSAFSDKAHPPDEEDLRAVLGAAYPAWSALLSAVTCRIPAITPLWGYTSKSTGWGLRLRHPSRVIVYMTPCDGHFLVSFVLGEKAVVQAHAARLPDVVLSAVDSAPRYAEGRGFRIRVSEVAQVAPLATLARIKNES
jgi:hypothetical protein